MRKQSIQKFAAVKKMMHIQIAIQERIKREQEHQELYWLTLPQELHPVSLPTSKEIHSRTNKFIQYNHNILLHLARTHPCTMQEHFHTVQNPTTLLQA